MIQFQPDIQYPINVLELPPTWIVATVGQAVVVRPGFSSSEHSDKGVGIPHLRPMNIDRKGHVVLDVVKYVTSTNTLRVKRGDVLFNNTNSAELVGKSAIFELEGDWAFSNHITRLRPNEELLPRFLAYQFLYLWMQGYFRARRKQHIGQASISLGTLKNSVPLILPPVAEQGRIVYELRRYFEQLDAAELAVQTSLTKLGEYRNMAILSGIDGTLAPNEAQLAKEESRQFESASLLLQRISEEYEANAAGHPEEKGYRSRRLKRENSAPPLPGKSYPLPEGWAWARVGQVGEVTLGRQRAPQHHNGPYMRPYLRVANVFEDRIDTSDVLEMNFTPEEYELFALQSGDILLNEGQSPELVGRPAMYRDELPGACFQNTLLRFRAYLGISPTYALLVFRAYLHNGRFKRIAKWSTNLAHLGHHRFANLEFPLPPLAEQERIVAEVDQRLEVAQELEQTLRSILGRIGSLRHVILGRAFRGELVSQDAKDELVKLSSASTASIQASPRNINPRAIAKENSMSKGTQFSQTVQRPLVEILADAGEPLAPEVLWQLSGRGEDLIDSFFDELKRCHSAGRITQTRDEFGKILLQLVEAG